MAPTCCPELETLGLAGYVREAKEGEDPLPGQRCFAWVTRIAHGQLLGLRYCPLCGENLVALRFGAEEAA